MKKVLAGILSALTVSFFAACSSEIATVADYSETGSLVVSSCDEVGRYLDASEITRASIKVYSSADVFKTSDDVTVSSGTGSFIVKDIPCGKNRVVEITGYKATGVEGKTLYAVTDISSGNNVIDTVKDGAESAKGKAYLALMKSGLNVQNVTLTGFVDNKSSYYFDADSFASDYCNNSGVNPSNYYTAAGTVTFSSIANASGYTIWISDPLSEKLYISSNSTVNGLIKNVACGTWNIYVNDGSSTKKAGQVTVAGNDVTYTDTIGNLLFGRTIIFVKATYSNIYAWYHGSTTVLNGDWPGNVFTSDDCSACMNNASGWKMLDITDVYNANLGTIDFIVTDGVNGKEFGDADLVSGKSATFWFDGSNYYDSDPTTVSLSDDASLKSISINGDPLTGFASGILSYSIEIASDVTSATINAVANDSNASLSVSPSSSLSFEEGETKAFTILVTAEDGLTTKTYIVNVTRKVPVVDDVSLSSVTVNGSVASASGSSYTFTKKGKEESLAISSVIATPVDSSASVKYSSIPSSVASGKTSSVTITVTNGSKSAVYTLIISYTQQLSAGQYGTNDKGYGVNKTISSWSDWTEDMQIARGAAYDDPRTWMGIQESPYDAYAMYAAYDDTNLYIMVELTNLPDGRASFMNHNYAGSDNSWWDNRDCPLGFIINTGKGTTSTSPTVLQNGKTGPIWGAVNFTDSEGFDFLFYGSSKYGYADHKAAFVGVGTPGLFKLNSSTGYFSYDADYCLSANSGAPGSEVTGTPGISVRYIRQCQVSSTVNFESTPVDNRATSGQTGEILMASDTYTAVSTNDLDMSYWYTIPLATLGIDKAYIQSNGIGVRQLTPNGGSLMDCLPWDPSMVDNATDPCSDDTSTSHEKEDVDNITSAQARIGK